MVKSPIYIPTWTCGTPCHLWPKFMVAINGGDPNDLLHPGRLTYKSPMKRKENDLNQTSMTMFHVNLQGCNRDELFRASYLPSFGVALQPAHRPPRTVQPGPKNSGSAMAGRNPTEAMKKRKRWLGIFSVKSKEHGQSKNPKPT